MLPFRTNRPNPCEHGCRVGDHRGRIESRVYELAGFLLARIAEDQHALADFDERFRGGPRWADECDARRRIVQLIAPDPREEDDLEGAEVLRIMALPYADHPDFREEWRI
jgi:hypothetical protein